MLNVLLMQMGRAVAEVGFFVCDGCSSPLDEAASQCASASTALGWGMCAPFCSLLVVRVMLDVCIKSGEWSMNSRS